MQKNESNKKIVLNSLKYLGRCTLISGGRSKRRPYGFVPMIGGRSGFVPMIVVLFVVVLAILGSKVFPSFAAGGSGDWPTYLHDNQRTGAANDTILSATNAAQLAPKWTFKTGGGIAAQPVVVGNTAYIGSWDGYEYALDATTGALQWKTFLGQTVVPACVPARTDHTGSRYHFHLP